MNRKFLCCFPLRGGNAAFGYFVMVISIAVAGYHLYELGINIKPQEDFEHDEKFKNWENLDNIFGRDKNAIVASVTMLYYLSYICLAMLLFFFALLFVFGANQANHCLVSTFFVYSFLHLFFSLILIVWEATSAGYIQLGLIILFDVILITCLFSVKHLMEAIKSGYIYSSPGQVYSH